MASTSASARVTAAASSGRTPSPPAAALPASSRRRERAGRRDGEEARREIARLQRARLLSAVTAAVVRCGVAELTVGDVLDGAGVSRRTFYELFDGLEECLHGALEQALAAACVAVGSAYDPAAPWRVRVRAGLAALLAFCEEEPLCAHLLLVDSLAAGPAVLERRKQVLGRLARELDAGRKERAAGRRELAASGPLLAEGLVGGVAAILFERVRTGERKLLELCGPLMAIVVLPYLGPAEARREQERPRPRRRPASTSAAGSGGSSEAHGGAAGPSGDLLRDLPIRLTYRTVRVLRTIAVQPGASNRQVGRAAGIVDQGQISKLLARLERVGLVRNEATAADGRGAPNRWLLTPRGAGLVRAAGGEVGDGRAL